jgi:hypothetical protein
MCYVKVKKDGGKKMIRNNQVELEATAIGKEIWPHFFTAKDMPSIESKQGGSSAAYYIREHCVRVRTNVWNKLLGIVCEALGKTNRDGRVALCNEPKAI